MNPGCHAHRFKASIRASLLTGLITSLAIAAQAVPLTQTGAELRVFGMEASTLNGGGHRDRDFFNNGNPLNGMVYTQKVNGNTTNTSITGGYTAGPGAFSAGSEFTGADPSTPIGALGVGGLAFKLQDGAASNTNLTPAGYNVKSLQLNVKFLDPRPPESVPGANFEGLLGSQFKWEAFTAWDFITPTAGASYGLRVNGGGVPNTLIFNDLLDLRVVTSLGGVTTVNFERISRDAGGSFFRTVLGSVPFSFAYGHNLANVDFIAMNLHRDFPLTGNLNPAVHATFTLMDVAGNNIVELGRYDFSDAATIYTNSTFAQVSARAAWLESTAPVNTNVPEPGSLALLGLGLAALGWPQRRRRLHVFKIFKYLCGIKNLHRAVQQHGHLLLRVDAHHLGVFGLVGLVERHHHDLAIEGFLQKGNLHFGAKHAQSPAVGAHAGGWCLPTCGRARIRIPRSHRFTSIKTLSRYLACPCK